MVTPLPSYAELPVVAGAPPGSSWGLWGEDDRLGCLNLLTPARAAAAAAALVHTGAAFPLDLDLAGIDPPLFRRSALTHTVLGPLDGPGHDDLLDGWNTQSSTQWDGFRHMRHPEHGWYGGAADGDHGVEHWAARGIVGRALLVDVARWREQQGRPLVMDRADPISAADVQATIDAQGTAVEVGDVLLVRTGWMGWDRALDSGARAAMAPSHANPGLEAGTEMVGLLWDLHVAAVAADNPSLEAWPFTADPMHHHLLPLLGMPIGELFVLDALADHCAATGRHACLFTSAPLHLRAGAASPPNALAIT